METTYKIGATFGIKDTFTTSLQGIRKENDKFRHDINKTKRDLDNTFDTKRTVKINTSNASSSISSLKNMIVGLGATYAFGKVVEGILSISASALKLSSDAEQAKIAFTTMLGSPDKATKFLKDMTQFANKTPFELPQVRDAAKKMLAFGFAADSIIPTLTGVGNASAGLGMGKDGIDRMTIALGQMKTKTKVQGNEMMQLTEAGIPAWQILADKMHKSTAEIMKMSEKGLIPADKAIQALIDGMNQRFPNMMEKQSKSLAGLWSTMKDTFNNGLLVKWGDGIAAALKPRFDKIKTWIDNNGATIDRWGKNIQKVASDASDWIIKKFEGAFSYVKSHFLNNPEFTKLPDLKSKIGFIFDDIYKSFKTWLDNGGQDQLNASASSLISNLSGAIEASAPRIAAAGMTVGKALGTSLVEGITNTIKESPIAAAITGALAGAAVGSAIPVVGTVTGAVAGAIGGYTSNKIITTVDNADKARNDKLNSQHNFIKTLDSQPKDVPLYHGDLVDPSKTKITKKPKKNGSHENGLTNVPYNGYMAELHKDERVLTAKENKTYSTNSGGNIFHIAINGVDKSIPDILKELVPQLKNAIDNSAHS